MSRPFLRGLTVGVSALVVFAAASVSAVSAVYLAPSTAFGPITGSGNCSTNGTLEQPPRDAADAQLSGFLATAAKDSFSTALFPDADVGSLGTGPYTLPIPSTAVSVSVALHNMTAADAGGATSTTPMSWGVPSVGTAPSLLFGATQQLQDCAVKPTRLTSGAEGGPLASPTAYWNATGFGDAIDQSTLDSVLFRFSVPVDNFGAWFGDLETRSDDVGGGDGGELAVVKLYDAAGNVLSVEPIVPNVQTPIAPPATPFGCGGPANADASACGNHGTRFIGFTWDSPDVAAFQVIVGDDDNCNQVPAGCDGFTERSSFIGPTIAFDEPELTFVKTVINDNFGTSAPGDFSLELITDPSGSPVVSTYVDGETVELQRGVEYAVREVAVAGYATTDVTCLTDEGSAGGTIDVPVDPTGFTPTVGDSQFRCTFVNDDVPMDVPLTVTKSVVNDDDGTATAADFEISVIVGGGTPVVVTSGTTIALTSDAEVAVGETPVSGYDLVSIECRDADENDLGATFIPAPSMVAVTCIVTNDDVDPATPPPTSTPPTTDPGDELPATGSSSSGPLTVALVARGRGAALLTAARRRA
jgi:hypothetical protein